MAAAIFDITVEQGATLQQTFYWKDAAGAVVDLTDFSARMQVKANYADTGAAALLTIGTADNTIVLTAATGKIVLAVSATATQALTFTKAVYDLEMVSGTGVVTRLLQGNVVLSKEVTR